MLRQGALAAVLMGCSGHSAAPEDARTVPRDAVPRPADASIATTLAVDAASPPLLECSARPHQTRGVIEVATDPATLRAEFRAFDTTKAPGRDLRLRAEPHDDETVFVFDRYLEGDSTFKGKPVPRPDHFQAGKDVIVRLQRVGGERRLVFDGAFQLPPDFDRGTGKFGYRCD